MGQVENDKHPMTEWSSFLNNLGVSEGTVENITNALRRASAVMDKIIEFGVVTPTILLNTFKEASEGVDMNVECLKALDGFNKRLCVQ